VPEDEVGALLGWADAVVLPYREASQSGVAAAAIAARRAVIATNVGGLAEQLRDETLAILCEPDAASLAQGLRRALSRPPVADETVPASPGAAWQELGRQLVEQVRPLLRPAGRPAPAGRAIGHAAPRLSD
jgi:glycosyltransferase involved in cell wall biosynthesis